MKELIDIYILFNHRYLAKYVNLPTYKKSPAKQNRLVYIELLNYTVLKIQERKHKNKGLIF